MQVKGTVSKNKCDISDYHVLFTNNTTGVTTEAVLDGEQYTVVLAAGFTYTASLSMATGFGFTNATKQVTVGETDFVGGKQDVQLDVEPKSVYHFTGKITGIDAGYDRSGLSITMKAPEDSLADDVTMDINDDLSFDAVLEPDVTYTVELAGINDYRVVTGGTIYDNQNHVEDIQVGRKPVYEVSGAFTGLDDQTAVTSLKFVNTLDQYEYEAQISGNGYHAQLRDGSYVAVAVVNGYNTKTHVVVNGGSVTKDLLFVSEDTTIKTIPRVADIYVGYPEKENNYETVGEAVAACQAMNPQSEDERVTVHIKPGTYREQIIINTPYLSFVNDEQGEVLLTWYYGIGYEYYSADQTGYYNTENAYDKYDKQTAAKWGCSTYLQNGAMGFRA